MGEKKESCFIADNFPRKSERSLETTRNLRGVQCNGVVSQGELADGGIAPHGSIELLAPAETRVDFVPVHEPKRLQEVGITVPNLVLTHKCHFFPSFYVSCVRTDQNVNYDGEWRIVYHTMIK